LAVNLALLFEAARDWARATDHYLLAARNAVQVFANHEAVSLARRGLELLGALPDGAERARKELRLQLTLSIPLVYLKTQASPEALATFARARALCEQLGEEEPLFSVQYGMTWGYYARGDWAQAHQQAEQCLRLAESRQDPVMLLQSHYVMGLIQSQAGEFLSAREHLEQAIALYSPEQHQFCAFVYGSDPGVYSGSLLSRTLWYLGYPDQAMKVLEDTLRLARQIKHPVSQGLALISACSSYRNYRQPQKVREMADQAIAIGTEHGLTQIVFAMIMGGWATAILDDQDAGIAQMQRALDAIRATGTKVTIPSYGLLLAEALGLAGRAREALALLDEALATATQITELHAEAEMFRLKGELLLQQDEGTTGAIGGAPDDSAEDCFRQAIAVAQRQHARSWELRAVTSLSRLYQRQGKRAEALPMLAKAYNSFSEGFDTADLRDAQSLLAELSSAADKR
jgi:predicted ATPase